MDAHILQSLGQVELSERGAVSERISYTVYEFRYNDFSDFCIAKGIITDIAGRLGKFDGRELLAAVD